MARHKDFDFGEVVIASARCRSWNYVVISTASGKKFAGMSLHLMLL